MSIFSQSTLTPFNLIHPQSQRTSNWTCYMGLPRIHQYIINSLHQCILYVVVSVERS